jgi:hypothetical protein
VTYLEELPGPEDGVSGLLGKALVGLAVLPVLGDLEELGHVDGVLVFD